MVGGIIMKEKADFSYLVRWLPVYIITSVIVMFTCGVMQIIMKFLSDSYTAMQLGTWIMSTVAVGAVMAITTYSLGLEKNNGRKPVSMAMPIVSQIICAAVVILAYALIKNVLIYGAAWFLEMALNNDGKTSVAVPFGKSVGYLTIQMLIYSAVSLGFYALAKYKKDHDPVVMKLRAGHKDANKTDDLFDKTRFNI